jgi:hypothetical protein
VNRIQAVLIVALLAVSLGACDAIWAAPATGPQAAPISPSGQLPVPTVTVPAQEVKPGITIVGTVLDVSFSAHVITLQEPVAGFSALALTEASELVSADQHKITLGDVRPGMRVEASGRPGESHALLASRVRLLEGTPTSSSE